MQLKMASTTSRNAISSMYQNLIKEWNKKPPNLDVIGKLLTSMKVCVCVQTIGGRMSSGGYLIPRPI